MKIKLIAVLVFLALVYSSQGQSLWSQIKEKLPWHSAQQEDDTLACKARKFVEQSKEYAEDVAEKLWASSDTENLACRAKEVGAKTLDTAQQVAGLTKDAAIVAGKKGKDAATYAAGKIASTAKVAGEMGMEMAGQMVEKATKLPAKAQTAVDAIGTFVESVSSDLRNVTFNFANCSSELNTTCKRCQKIKLGLLGIDDEICITLTYLPEEYALSTSLDLGSANLYKSKYSLSNPPPICFVPAGFDKIANVCLILSDLNVNQENKQLHGCLALKVSLFYDSIDKSYIKDLGCFNLGP